MLALVGAAPQTTPQAAHAPSAAVPVVFPPASSQRLPNGVVVTSQLTTDTPLVGVQVFLPAGAANQSSDRAGVAAVTAAMVLQTPVERGTTLAEVGNTLGAAIAYTIDPQHTRFTIECKASDLPRLVGDFAAALKNPDASRFENARTTMLVAANSAIKNPALASYAMVRQAEFEGTAYGRPDTGSPSTLASLAPADASAFAAQYRHGPGTIVALTGNVTPDVSSAVSTAFADFAPTAAPRAPKPPTLKKTREVVAHRDVSAPWVAVGFAAPSQFSADFPAMLVIETLLGAGGDVHAFSFGSDFASPEDFVGGYYQFESEPGIYVEFFNGANVDRDLRNLEDELTRLRGTSLTSPLVERARTATLGEFLTSVTTLDDQSWLLGRSALSPSGVVFENSLPARIAAVGAADVQRVARKYFATETIAVVLPAGGR